MNCLLLRLKILRMKYDRTVLILDIFGERAKTREAKLQVEVASLEYALPRLIGANEQVDKVAV